MRSMHGDRFNHDDDAHDYDRCVQNRADPIRDGYDEALKWVIREARIDSTARVLELGSGTGNLSSLIGSCAELVCVDLSERMEEIARQKLTHIAKRTFIKADILDVFPFAERSFDSVISTYAIHHLTAEEKSVLFREVARSLRDGGRAVFGDLMVQNEDERRAKIEWYRAKGDTTTAEAIHEEFFWIIHVAVQELRSLGLEITVKRFSDLSYGLAAKKIDLKAPCPKRPRTAVKGSVDCSGILVNNSPNFDSRRTYPNN